MRLVTALLTAAVLPLAACGGPSIELDDEVLQVIHASPHHGAIEVATDVVPRVGFNLPLERDQLAGVRLEVEEAGGFVEVATSRVPRDEDRVVLLVPEAVLGGGQRYRLRVERGVVAKGGMELGAEFVAEFRTRE